MNLPITEGPMNEPWEKKFTITLTVSSLLRNGEMLGTGDPERDAILFKILETIRTDDDIFREFIRAFIPELFNQGVYSHDEMVKLLTIRPGHEVLEKAAFKVSGTATALVAEIYGGGVPGMDGDALEGFCYQLVSHLDIREMDVLTHPPPLAV